MDYYDLIIVGGGPAGSTLAWALQSTGKRILLIDKATFPRDKDCAGWVTPAVFDALQIDPTDYGSNHALEPIRGFRIGMMGRRAVENDHGETVSYGVRRAEFDHYLIRRIRTDLALDTSISAIRQANGNWEINQRWETPLLIGAGGHFCPVARFIGAGPGNHESVVTTREMEFEMTAHQASACQARGDRPELWFCRDLRGYAWIFRKGNHLNVGLGREEPRYLGRHLDRFVALMQQQQRIPADLPRHFRNHTYLLYDRAERPLVDDGLMLIGDAAGLAFGPSGEGIRPAVESALIAANVIRAEPDLTARSLQPYGEAIARRFGTRSLQPDNGTRMPDWVRVRLAGSLMKSHWFTRKVVTERWFLHQQVPPLDLPAPTPARRESPYWRPA